MQGFFVWAQEWEESERGWGCRPDGYKLYTKQELVKPGTEAALARQQEYFKHLGPGVVPDEYSRPCGLPFTVQVSKETHDKVELHEGYHISRLKEVEIK